MFKKLFFAAFLLLPFLPSLAFADRFGSIRAGADVSLTTNTILNSTSYETGKTFWVDYGSFNSNAYVLNRLSIGHASPSYPLDVQYSASGLDMAQFYDTAAFGSSSGVRFYGKAFGGAKTLAGSILWSTTSAYIQLLHAGGLGLKLSAAGSIQVTDHMYFSGSKHFNFNDADDSAHVGLGVPAVVASSYDLILPPDPGTLGQSLVTDGAGNLSFQTIASTYTNFVVSGVIGSSTGTFNIAGTTLTFDEPPIDTLDRIMVVNNGQVSFPEMADGAQLSAYNNFTSSNVFSSVDTSSFTYGLSVGSLTVNDLGASKVVATNSAKKLVTLTIPDCDNATNDKLLYDVTTNSFSCGSDQNSGGAGGGDGLGTHNATQTVTMNGNAITGVSSITVNAGGVDWVMSKSSTSMLMSSITGLTTGTQTFTLHGLAAGSTYSVTGCLMFNITSGVGGIKMMVDTPDDVASLTLYLDGTGTSTAGYRTDEGLFADFTGNANPFGGYNGNEGVINFRGFIVMGPTGGDVRFAGIIIAPTAIDKGSYATFTKVE